MSVSILIANYNNGGFFKECYESLLAQTYTQWEAIIVDDCSTDDSIEIINRLIEHDGRFKLIKASQNKGVGFTKHRCVTEASGKWCAFVDPDDALEPNALEKMVNVFAEAPETVLAHSSFSIHNASMQVAGRHERARAVPVNDSFFMNFDGEVTHFALFSREAYLATEGIDGYMKRAVDQDLYLKLYEKGPFVFVNEYLYKYRVHERGISTGQAEAGADKALYWHWYACNAAAKRRGIVLENEFVKQFVKRSEYNSQLEPIERLRKNIFYKILKRLV